MHLPRRPPSALHLGRFFCTPFPHAPCAPSAPRECAGLRPSPPLRGYRCAPRRGARSAQRARNERATSEERASIGVAGRPFGPRSVFVGRQAVGRRSVGGRSVRTRAALALRSAGGRSGRSARPCAVHPLRPRGSGRTRCGRCAAGGRALAQCGRCAAAGSGAGQCRSRPKPQGGSA